VSKKPKPKLELIRPLKTSDLFAASRALKAMGLKVDLRGKVTVEEVGADLMTQVITRLGDAEAEITGLIGGLAGMTGAEFADLELEKALPIVRAVARSKGLQGFLELLPRPTIRASSTPSAGATRTPPTS